MTRSRKNNTHWAIQTWWSTSPDRRRLLHTNWVNGVGIESFPGAAPVALFETQLMARTWLKALRADEDAPLPMSARVVKVIIEPEEWVQELYRLRDAALARVEELEEQLRLERGNR